VLFRNVSGLGDMTVTLDARRVNVAHGDTVEAIGADAQGMLAQPETWERVDKPSQRRPGTTDTESGQ